MATVNYGTMGAQPMSGFGGAGGMAGAGYQGMVGTGYVPVQPQLQTQIGGNLPFGAMSQAGSIPFAGNPQQLAQSYAQSYNAALAMNQANYANILQGYQNALQEQANRQTATQEQYYELDRRIMGDLANAGQTRRQEIQDEYAALAGRQNQQLIDRGLGNSTIQAAVTRGLSLDEQKAQNMLAEQVANLRARYGTDIGLQRIGYGGQATREWAGMTGAQLDWMNSVQAPYPDAGLYASLAAQYEQAKAAERAAGSGYGFQSQMPGGMTSTGLGYTGYRPPSYQSAGSGRIAAPTGMGYNSALAVPAGPTGYVGEGSIPVLGSGDSGNALAAVTGYPVLQGSNSGGSEYAGITGMALDLLGV